MPGRPDRLASRVSATSAPRLLKPIRLITARSSTSRNSRGLGLPACGRGVIEPTSANPKPRPKSWSGTSASLSNPAAIPSGLGNCSPATSTARGPVFGGPARGETASALTVRRWASSGSILKSSGRARSNIMRCAMARRRYHVETLHEPWRAPNPRKSGPLREGLSLAYNQRAEIRSNTSLRPEGLGAFLQRVLDFKGVALTGYPLFLSPASIFGGASHSGVITNCSPSA